MATNLEIIPIKEWLDYKEHPLVISGPCSAENEEQVINTAKQLAQIHNVKVYRAGLWKPRTRPNYFEGVGSKGLVWLQRVKEETNLKVAVEVAKPSHIEKCLAHGIDILWIGARTVVNPFSVQEIAEALKGVDIPVMVKNPINPDLTLWMGALERVNKSGIKKLVAVHRGFYSLNQSMYRNPPMWEIPIELKRLVPNIPIIVDPSHICGNKELLLDISQKAMDLEMDGLMIESHIKPWAALSDAKQQIEPKNLKLLLGKIVIREMRGTKEFENKLTSYRNQIDEIDDELLDILGRRLKIVDEIGQYKNEHKITILQLKRWSYIIEDRLKKGLKHNLDRDFLQKLLELMHAESLRIQTEIMNKTPEN
ncbi:MAG: 3-deoxy-7-phosphoheptulonate synthase [Bacteroidetes bacterium HGW-Bacteroidetes-17]|nr:MAG: 3-deoxy-7-phosphoheptulonate synthase [Bacteroidetes bacterium HGW-Bacteroidetes-17]